MYVHPEAEHLLDWFHIAMRVTAMGQVAKGIATDELDIEKPLERMKWYMWHGNVFRALQVIDDLVMDLEDIELTTENVKKLRKMVGEFRGYIAANRPFIPNYGDRYRHGETISTAFVEATLNQVVSRRMVKQQQMRWTQRGAHLLEAIRKPSSTVVHRSSSLLAVMKFRAAAWRESVQPQLDVTNLDHRRT
jgi:hypothetical protein